MSPTGISSSDSTARLGFAGVAFAFLVTMLGTTLPTPLYPGYQAAFDFSQLVITVIFAAYAVGVIAALLITGRWSDQLGRRPLLFAGLVAAALSDVVFLAADGLSTLLVGRVLSGMSAGIFTGTATVAVVESAPAAWKRTATFVATAANMGGLGLGPVVAGALGEYAAWPLHLAYAVHLGLLAIAVLGVAVASETVTRPPRVRLRIQRLKVPAEVRGVFVPAVIAGFAGFAVLGFFTATAPAFMSQVLGHSNLLAIGLVAGCVFFASTLGQLVQGRLPEAHRLPLGCAVVIVGALTVGTGLALATLWVFLLGALIVGLGQGIAFRAGLGAVAAACPLNQRGAVTSTFFVIAYVAISTPVVGIGLVARLVGLQATGVGFAIGVAALAGAALVSLQRQRAATAVR